MENNYRIVEGFGKFTIEIEDKEIKAHRNFLGRVKKIETITTWKGVTHTGQPLYSHYFSFLGIHVCNYGEKMPDFDSLEDAGKVLAEIKKGYTYYYDTNIPLTPEILQKYGFKGLPHFTIQNSMRIDIGRGRVISVGCIGTPNEMVFLTEEEPSKVNAVIMLRNYDYDGKTYLHHIKDIYFSLTRTELIYTP